MFRLPWVSRGRYDDLRERMEKIEAERDEYLAVLLGKPRRVDKVIAIPAAGPVHVDVDEMEQPELHENVQPEAFTTPFDRLQVKAAKAFGKGKMPIEFRARV